MITLVGTNHVSKQSAKDVEAAILDADVVGIELDRGRAQALMSGAKASFSDIRKVLGLKAAVVISTLRYVQEKIAAPLGVTPGLEMKKAIEVSQQHGKIIALIDRDISITAKGLSKALGWKEAWQFCKDLFHPKKMSLEPTDEMVLDILTHIKTAYPRVYKILISDRDEHMAHALIYLQEKHPEKRIVAIVGKGHIPGITERIKHINRDLEVRVWRSQATK